MPMATDLRLRTAYWGDATAKSAFRALAREVFDLDFGAWESSGYWTDRYRPFTYFDDRGCAVANVCVNEMSLVVEGRPVRAAQFSTVATSPEWRRQGLARALVREALAWIGGEGFDFSYLFASEEALPLYRSFGFVPTEETLPVLRLARTFPAPREGAVPLDMECAADRGRLHRLALAREPVSRRIGSLDDSIFMFHATGPLRKAISYLPEHDVAVLWEREGAVLTLRDVVGPRVPPLREWLPILAQASDREVVFRFEPDKMGAFDEFGSLERRPWRENNLHVRGTLPAEGPFVFPLTAQA